MVYPIDLLHLCDQEILRFEITSDSYWSFRKGKLLSDTVCRKIAFKYNHPISIYLSIEKSTQNPVTVRSGAIADNDNDIEPCDVQLTCSTKIKQTKERKKGQLNIMLFEKDKKHLHIAHSIYILIVFGAYFELDDMSHKRECEYYGRQAAFVNPFLLSHKLKGRFIAENWIIFHKCAKCHWLALIELLESPIYVLHSYPRARTHKHTHTC